MYESSVKVQLKCGYLMFCDKFANKGAQWAYAGNGCELCQAAYFTGKKHVFVSGENEA